MKELDEIRARLAAAAEGPWRWDENFDPQGDKDSGLALTNGVGVEIIGAYNHHCCSYRDDPTVDDNSAALIAHAPTDLARLLAAIDAVEKLHTMERVEVELWQYGLKSAGDKCRMDGQSWPCETTTALTAALTPTTAEGESA